MVKRVIRIVSEVAHSSLEADEIYSDWASQKYPQEFRRFDDFLRKVSAGEVLGRDRNPINYLDFQKAIQAYQETRRQ